MSVKARLEDAMVLWDQGRREGAWVLVLVAAAATARKRYPLPMGDRQSFTSFIRDVQRTILDGVHPPGPSPTIVFDAVRFEDLLYQQMRCNLVHEAELNPAVALAESRIVDGQLRAQLRAGPVNEIPDFWVIHLAKAVRLAPENAAEFATGPRVTGSWRIW